MHDLFSNVKLTNALNGATISSNTTTAGAIIDTQAFNTHLFAIRSSARTDGTFTPLVQEGDASDLSDAADVADADLVGTEAGAAITAANKSAKVGYKGSKRYIRLSIVSTSVTSGAHLSALCIQGSPKEGPISTQVV